MRRLLVNTKRLHLRQTSDKIHRPIGLLKKGEIVEVIRFSRDFYWVEIKRRHNGQTGWASYKYFLGVPDRRYIKRNDPMWLKIAFGERETGIDKLPGPEDNSRIIQYLKTCESLPEQYQNEDETPWCSAFVNWCIEKSCHEGTDDAWALSWGHDNWGRVVQPQSVRRGAIAVFKRYYTDKKGERKTGGHVGFYLGKDPKNANQIRILGGNQRDSVRISSYPKSNNNYELQCFKLPYTNQTM